MRDGIVCGEAEDRPSSMSEPLSELASTAFVQARFRHGLVTEVFDARFNPAHGLRNHEILSTDVLSKNDPATIVRLRTDCFQSLSSGHLQQRVRNHLSTDHTKSY
jgi:hypothetical protein